MCQETIKLGAKWMFLSELVSDYIYFILSHTTALDNSISKQRNQLYS